MGGLFSKVWSSKRSFREHLEHLENEIKRLEDRQHRNAIIKRQLVSSIVLWSGLAYILCFLGYYCLAFPPTWSERLLYATPFFIAPFLIHVLSKSAHYFFERRYQKYGESLKSLKEEKVKVLEEVIETESFKNAKELLERFDPQSTFLRPTQQGPGPANLNMSMRGTPGHDMELRRRNVPGQAPTTPLKQQDRPVAAATPQPRPATPPKRSVKPQRKLDATPKPQTEVSPVPKNAPKVMSSCSTQTVASKSLVPTGVASPRPSMQIVREYLLPGHVKNERASGPPRPIEILPQQRTSVDKFVEFVIGDGPNNRFALICSQCHSHNGMALAEDYEYTTFRCAYCFTVNPARRNTPLEQRVYRLPNMQVKAPEIIKQLTNGDEEEEGAVITELEPSAKVLDDTTLEELDDTRLEESIIETTKEIEEIGLEDTEVESIMSDATLDVKREELDATFTVSTSVDAAVEASS